MSDDDSAAASGGNWNSLKSLGPAVTIIGSLVTIVLTAWNTAVKTRIDSATARLEATRVELEASRDRVARYQFVRSILTGIDSTGSESQALSVNLIRLALDSAEANRLFSGLTTSRDTSLAQVGSIGVAAIADQAVVTLVQRLVGPTRSTRVAASEALKQRYVSSQAAVRQVLSLLEPPQIDALTPDGRINALDFLRDTGADAWGPDELTRGTAVLATLQRMSAANAPGIGAKTRELIAAFATHLHTVASTQRAQG